VKIIWDKPKRLSNLVKHSLDFADIEDGFDFDGAIVLAHRCFVWVGCTTGGFRGLAD
jgi:uncharacterized DUF497 family protein